MAHGKSTVVKAISGVHTVRFKNELERNITIKLGYANAKVRPLVTADDVLVREALHQSCFMFLKHCRCTSWTTPAVPGQSATGRVAAAPLMSSPQISLEPKAASNWSGETAEEGSSGRQGSCFTSNTVVVFVSDTCLSLTVLVTTF